MRMPSGGCVRENGERGNDGGPRRLRQARFRSRIPSEGRLLRAGRGRST